MLAILALQGGAATDMFPSRHNWRRQRPSLAACVWQQHVLVVQVRLRTRKLSLQLHAVINSAGRCMMPTGKRTHSGSQDSNCMSAAECDAATPPRRIMYMTACEPRAASILLVRLPGVKVGLQRLAAWELLPATAETER